MLRFMFGEPEDQLNHILGYAYQAMERFEAKMRKQFQADQKQELNLRKYEIWTIGLRSSLNELEQSHYAAGKFRTNIHSSAVANMSNEEKLNYDRYVYFDKNGFIRVFSLLDKLGTFLNDWFHLRTEKIKPHFSYFTALRNMRENKVHMDLTSHLNAVKEQYKEPMARLRKRRNTEIHYMNSEMQDDLIQSQRMYGEEVQLENISLQAKDLSDCLNMVSESLRLVFQYLCKVKRN